MKNLAEKDIEAVEELPSRVKVRPPDGGWGHYNDDYPWNKVNRFLLSRVGRNWDDVYSEFHSLEWVPARHKNLEQLEHNILFHTFMKDGKVWYFDKYLSDSERPIDELDTPNSYYYSRDDVFYIHPETKILLYKKKKSHASYIKRKSAEEAKTFRVLGDYHQLLKLRGTWFEVKGHPVKDEVIKVDGLHYREVPLKPWQKIINGKLVSEIVPTSEMVRGRIIPEKTYYKIWQGKLLEPVKTPYGYRYRNRDCDIGPRDRMISDGVYSFQTRRANNDSVKITLYRQLSSKELKKYGLKNDIKGFPRGKRCDVCGGYDCQQQHNPQWKTALDTSYHKMFL